MPLGCGMTFSVRNVVSSLLINLFDGYGDRTSYFIALSEFVDFDTLRELSAEFVASHAEFAKAFEGDDAFEDVSDGDDIARAFRRKTGVANTKKALRTIGASALKGAQAKGHFLDRFRRCRRSTKS